MAKHGGKRDNAGRKSKAEEQALIERLSPLEDLAHIKLHEAIRVGEQWALKMYFEYMYGKPAQGVDLTTKGDKITDFTVQIVNKQNGS